MRGTRFIKWFFLLWICLEIASFVWVAELVGLGWMLILIIAGTVVGVMLLRREGLRTANLMMSKVRKGERPSPADLAETPFVMLGALLLIIPGFLSDIVGILCFLPPIRYILVKMLSKKGAAHAAKHSRQQKIHKGRTFDGDYHRED